MSTIGLRVRLERDRVGITLYDLAERCGVSPAQQQDIENEKLSPEADYLGLAAQAGLDVVFVLTGQRQKPTAAERQLLADYRAGASEKGRSAVETHGAAAPQRLRTTAMMATLALSGSCLAGDAADDYWSSKTKIEPAASITAKELVAAFARDPTGTDRAFDRGLIEIRGSVFNAYATGSGKNAKKVVALLAGKALVVAELVSDAGFMGSGRDREARLLCSGGLTQKGNDLRVYGCVVREQAGVGPR